MNSLLLFRVTISGKASVSCQEANERRKAARAAWENHFHEHRCDPDRKEIVRLTEPQVRPSRLRISMGEGPLYDKVLDPQLKH
ncbi:MAG: hypothetical protein JWO80_4827 [Bryobacterales bacterium]|nr:hypothetical protein [Bryobacterales bacterium]